MAINKMYSEPMLAAFRKMMQDCTDKNYSGEDFDKMAAALKRMEDLAEELNDFNEYNATLMKEGLQMKFSQHYSAVLSNAAQAKLKSDDGSYDDSSLLATTVKAYEDAILRLQEAQDIAFKDAKGDVSKIKTADKVIPILKKVVKFGKSGVSLPVFLTTLIKKGLEKALEGQVATRSAIEFEIEINKAQSSITPIVKMHEERLAAFDKMAENSLFKLPDSFEFNLKSDDLYRKYASVIDKWRQIESRWSKIFDLVYDWLDSYCKFALWDTRWRPPGCKDETLVKKNIRRTKGCNPGILKQRERIFKECFNLSWDDIFSHPTFIFRHSTFFFPFSKERFNLLKKTYLYCKPESNPATVEEPPKELIDMAEKLHNEKKCSNPDLEKGKLQMIKVYNNYWGEGAYEKKYSS